MVHVQIGCPPSLRGEASAGRGSFPSATPRGRERRTWWWRLPLRSRSSLAVTSTDRGARGTRGTPGRASNTRSPRVPSERPDWNVSFIKGPSKVRIQARFTWILHLQLRREGLNFIYGIVIWSLVIREDCPVAHCVEVDLSAGGHYQVVKVLDLIVCIWCVIGAQWHARPVQYVGFKKVLCHFSARGLLHLLMRPRNRGSSIASA